MLYAVPFVSRKIDTVKKRDTESILSSQAGKIRLTPINDNCVRITYTERADFVEEDKPGVNRHPEEVRYELKESEKEIWVGLKGMELCINRDTGAIAYYRVQEGEKRFLFRENPKHPREVEEFTSYQLAGDEQVKVEKVETVDGVKDMVREATRIPSDTLYHTRLYIDFSEEEGIYGFGQQEEGFLNLRGKTVYVHQANRKIAMPMLISSLGYGILMDTYSPMIFNDSSVSTYLYTEADKELDYYVMVGENPNQVVKQYRQLTGKAALLPKWAFGYLQSQERYETEEELLQIAGKYREKHLGLDCLILDWCSWEDNQWGQKSFDPKRFPNPTQMIQKLHEKDVHFMMSIWPNMAEGTVNHEQMQQIHGFLAASDVYNALSAEARELYWKQIKEKLFCHGVDAWWCDSSEPLTIEWTHKNRMEPGTLFSEYQKELADHMPAAFTNAFPLYHARTLYEGQRKETEEKRVCNLTRSAYTGQQRYGTILWSGDTAASWDTLRSQIAEGLNLVSSGLPYWTVDIGAFFVKKSNFWYWDGEYQDTTKDAGYRELYTRWFQWAAFLPVFRAHGTDCRREMWEFDALEDDCYDAMVQANQLRYQLMPLIYSQAGKVWLEDAMMMKPLVFDYPSDTNVLDLRDEYLFCESILVCPVTEPMYYGPGNEKRSTQNYTRKVYLPEGNGWYDFWSNSYYEGGQWIEAAAPIERIPLFVKEGSILPMGAVTEHVVSREELTYRVYDGKDCSYSLYQDAGDGYGYEKGEYELQTLFWDSFRKTLTDGKGNVLEAEVIGRER